MLSLQLRSAATDADESKLQRLLQNVDPAVERDEENYTALHYAAWGGLAKVVDVYVNSKVRGPLSLSLSRSWLFLIPQKGVDVNARNDNGETPLHLAAGYGRYETVREQTQGEFTNGRSGGTPRGGWRAGQRQGQAGLHADAPCGRGPVGRDRMGGHWRP